MRESLFIPFRLLIKKQFTIEERYVIIRPIIGITEAVFSVCLRLMILIAYNI